MTASDSPTRIEARLAALAATPASRSAPATSPRRAAAAEARGEGREKVYRSGRLQISPNASIACVVLDLSRGGARVQYDPARIGLPEFLSLEFDASGVIKRARVIWQKDNFAGLAFLDPTRKVFGERSSPFPALDQASTLRRER